ncbi:MAG: DUF5060 domain-containing protein [Verrucomicrobia bacterium]|nr:DUF5060 domain-containing protein [Verrucomicrobiota bacterium]
MLTRYPIPLIIISVCLIQLCSSAANYKLEGELKQWHRVTLTFDGPVSGEEASINPFLDYRLEVSFSNGDQFYSVPGYFAADGNAAETRARGGNKWRVHFMPDAVGEWTFEVLFKTGSEIAISKDKAVGQRVSFNATTGSFVVAPSDKSAPDTRSKGKLAYVGKRYLQFQGNGEYYLKSGPDSPENLLAYKDFDDTLSHNPDKQFLKDWAPHLQDWNEGDPTWQSGKGKALIGAMNYLGSQRMNVVYFLTMNIIGDGQDVWPYTDYDERYRFDCSKLDQWEIVFSHMDRQGIVLHVVTQETENDHLLDEGELGVQRKLYYRELIARFAHHPAIIWNLGEESTNTPRQQMAFADYFKSTDPYQHPTALHTHSDAWEKHYRPMLGHEGLDVLSFQTRDHLKVIHQQTVKWTRLSQAAGHTWTMFIDEPGMAWQGVEPDSLIPNNQAAMRKYALWGNLMAGGAGVEWYFGYELPHSDLNCEDWRSRENMWAYSRYALEFFKTHLPFHQMKPDGQLTSSERDYVLAKEGDVYAIYYPEWEHNLVDLREHTGTYSVSWFNPRTGDGPHTGEKLRELYPRRRVASLDTLESGGCANIGHAPYDHHEDWVVILQRLNE